MREALAPLKLPGFRHLAAAYWVNEIGNWLGEIALAVLVFDKTGSPLATAGLFLGMQFLPALISQGLVARVEVSGTRRGLPAVYAAEGLTFALIAALADDFVLAAIIALATLDGALALAGRAFTRAAAAAVLTPAGRLREGNAILNVGFTTAGAVGPLLAGLVVAGLGVQAALLLDAASFLAVAVMLAAARSLPSVKAEPQPWRERLRDGLRYVRANPIVGRLLGVQALAFVFFAAVIPIEIVYAKETLDAGDSGYGALLASWGIGMVAGSLVFAAASRMSMRLLLFISTIVIGFAYLAMAGAQSLAAACVAAAVGGAGNGVQWVSVMTSIQGFTSSGYQARVVALLESIGFAMPGLGFVIGGVTAELLEPRASFVVAGAGVLAVVIVAIPLLGGARWPQETVSEGLAADDLSPAELQPAPSAHALHPRPAPDPPAEA
jgi:MFS family permease